MIDEDCVVGFLDGSSPQTTANTVHLGSFNKPTIIKNTTKLRANTFGFYAFNGKSIIEFKERSTKENVCDFLLSIKKSNEGKRIVIILDNFRSHRVKDTVNFSLENNIDLVYLPPYSPDLNPIEFIWKSVKRVISCNFVHDIDCLKNMIAVEFMKCSLKLSFAKRWIEKFMDDKLEMFS